jgi:hypothetical protein
MKMYLPTSLIFSSGIALGEYDTLGWINFHISNTAGKHILSPLERSLSRIFKNHMQIMRSDCLWRFPVKKTIALAGKPARLPRGWITIFISRNMIWALPSGNMILLGESIFIFLSPACNKCIIWNHRYQNCIHFYCQPVWSYSKIREITIVITVTYVMKRRLNNEPIFWYLWFHIIHSLHAGEGNMKIDSPKSIIFPEGNARGEYDIRG